MSWKYIFNTTVGDKFWGIIFDAQEMAKKCGYVYYSWNDRIYNVDGSDSGYTVKDCY